MGTNRPKATIPCAFTVQDSNCVKGIGIILMLFHHLFNDLPEYAGYPVSYFPFTQHRLTQIALLGKVCVALFVWVSGYGLSISYLRAKERGELGTSDGFLRFSLSRWWGLMMQYWFVFAIALLCQPLGRTVVDAYGSNLKEAIRPLLVDIAGISFACKTSSLNPTWWYMTLAIWFLFAAPLVNDTIDRLGIVWGTALWLAISMGVGRGSDYGYYLTIFLVGVVSARTGVFDTIDARLNSRSIRFCLGLACCVVVALLMIWRLQGHGALGMTYGLVATFTAMTCYLILTNTVLGRVLSYLGQHSTNMFLFHNLLYCYYFLGFFYSWHWWGAITAMLVVVSLVCGLAMEWAEEKSGYNRMMHDLGQRLRNKIGL